MHRRLVIVVILCIIAVIGIVGLYSGLLHPSSDAENKKAANYEVLYRIGVHEFPPLIIYQDGYENEPTGFDRDMIRWIGNEMNFDVKFILMAWSDVFNALEAKEIDMILGGPSITPERLERFLFSDPYLSISQSIVVSEHGTMFMDDFWAGRGIVGAEAGTTSYDIVKEALLDTGILPEENLKDYHPIESSIQDLIDGKVHFIISDWPVMVRLTQEYPAYIIGNIDTGEEYGIVIHKENEQLQQAINTGLDRLQASIDWNEMKHRYLLDY